MELPKIGSIIGFIVGEDRVVGEIEEYTFDTLNGLPVGFYIKGNTYVRWPVSYINDRTEIISEPVDIV